MSDYLAICNTKIYDVVTHFQSSRTLVWKQIPAANTGDIVFLYVGRPYKRVMFQCRVTSINLEHPNAFYWDARKSNQKASYMELLLEREFDYPELEYYLLLNNGLKTVQCATKVSGELSNYIYHVIGVK